MEVRLSTKLDPTDVLLLDGRNHMTGDLDLRGNKIIFPSEIDMDRKLITNLDTDSNQDLSAVNMITLKNKVEPKADKNYVDFEITKQNALINSVMPALKRTRLTASAWRKTNWCINCVLMRVMERRERDNS